MPLVDSFLVDHTIMPAPSVRLAKVMSTPKGDEIEVWDLRFKKPNHGMMPEKGIHTFEHFFAGFMREHINKKDVIEVIDISPMGCKTGFYRNTAAFKIFTGDDRTDRYCTDHRMAARTCSCNGENQKDSGINTDFCSFCIQLDAVAKS